MAKAGKTENDADKTDKSKSGDSLPLTDRLDAARKADVLRKWDKTRRDQ